MTIMRRCLDCGAHTPYTRCTPCRLALQRSRDHHPAKVAKKRALYKTPEYRAARKQWVMILGTGIICICPRCKARIYAGQAWDLGHQPNGGALRPEHAHCNRSAH